MFFLAAALFLLLPVSCEKDKHRTPHPDRGALVIDAALPVDGAVYVADVDGVPADFATVPFCYPALLEPGTSSLVVYNRAGGFTFDGRTARIDAPADGTRADAATVIPLPGDLYTGTRALDVVADDTLRVVADFARRTRDLRLELTVTQGRPELIQTVTATLGGIAGAFDMEAEQTVGEPVSTVFAFTREGSKLTADARLLGTMGDVQTLVLDIVFTDGGRTQHTEVELTEAMKEFNGDMTTAYRVTGTLETPVGMEEGKGEITGWETGDGGGDVSAEMQENEE